MTQTFLDSQAVRRSLRFTLMIGAALSLSACSTTPDRYAFWRDDADATVASKTKPNLSDIPAAPNVEQARKDMQDLQTRLAADRDAAYQQAQSDTGLATATPLASISSAPVNTDTLPPVSSQTLQAANIQPVTMNAITPSAPAMNNPNRMPTAGTWPVYTPPSVQINPPSRPFAANGPTQPYVYGRSGVQFRNQMQQNAFAPPALPANESITVDMSALGGPSRGSRMGAGPQGGAPFRPFTMPMTMGGNAIYFGHGSTRLSPNDRRTLSSLAADAASRNATVRVIGHASTRAETGSPSNDKAANLKISADRAVRVMQELTRHGIAAQQVAPMAVGDSDARQAPSENAARRVDIVIE